MGSNQYDLELDYFIVKSLYPSEKMGYNDLSELVKSEYKSNVSPTTFNDHIEYLDSSDMIYKTRKWEPFTLTEECKQLLRLEILDLSPPVKKRSTYASKQAALRQIDLYILLLVFKSGIAYEFKKEEDLEYLLSEFKLSMNSLTAGRFIDNNLTYLMEFDSKDKKICVQKRRDSSGAYSFTCHIKGVKYPLNNHISDPFRVVGITQAEITNALLLLSNENVLQEPIIYSDDRIYIVQDLQLYDLLSDLVFDYEIVKSTLKKLWELRKPTLQEKEWLLRIEDKSAVTKSIESSQIYRRRTKLPYYNRKKQIKKIIKKSMSELKQTGEWIDEEYKETLSNQKHYFLIREIVKLIFPNWFQEIKTKIR